MLLKIVYMSVDPYMRARMNKTKNYFEVFKIGYPCDVCILNFREVLSVKYSKVKTQILEKSK